MPPNAAAYLHLNAYVVALLVVVGGEVPLLF